MTLPATKKPSPSRQRDSLGRSVPRPSDEPPPLPEDPQVLAAMRARIEEGIAEAHQGVGDDWESVRRRLFQR